MHKMRAELGHAWVMRVQRAGTHRDTCRELGRVGCLCRGLGHRDTCVEGWDMHEACTEGWDMHGTPLRGPQHACGRLGHTETHMCRQHMQGIRAWRARTHV